MLPRSRTTWGLLPFVDISSDGCQLTKPKWHKFVVATFVCLRAMVAPNTCLGVDDEMSDGVESGRPGFCLQESQRLGF